MTEYTESMPTKFALVCDTVFQGWTIADGDLYDTSEEAYAELEDLRHYRDESRIEDGEEPEGDDDDYMILSVFNDPDGNWYTVECGQQVFLMEPEGSHENR